MKKLLLKELRLAAHPTNFIFLALSALILVPNYPYYVTFFYTMLGVFFMCLHGRENHDIVYSVSLPVRKADIVKARVGFVVILEMLQLLLAAAFAVLRQAIMPIPNAVGMDANTALFGLSLVMLGLFNWLFFTAYYKSPNRIGRAFVTSTVVVFVFMLLAETAAHIVPFVKNQLDTPDPAFMPAKLAVLLIGAVLYTLLTLLAIRQSVRQFVALDL